MRIGHASSDENGKYKNGKAGDQNGREVYVRDYYNRPFLIVLRAKTSVAQEKIAQAMERACANDHIGYDQNQRTTLFTEAKKVNFDLSKITNDCETDCSALVAVCVNAAGISVSKDCYTGNLKDVLLRTGMFDIAYESQTNTAPESIIIRGDILLYPYHHVAVALDSGTGDKQGFVKENGKWYYYKDGDKLKREWILHNHHWYRLGIDGAMLTGWHKVYDDKGILRDCYFQETGEFEGAEWHETSNHVGYLEIWYVD